MLLDSTIVTRSILLYMCFSSPGLQSNELMKSAEEIKGTSRIKKKKNGFTVACLPSGGIAFSVMQFLYGQCLDVIRPQQFLWQRERVQIKVVQYGVPLTDLIHSSKS
jgi:hypothetical protein